jgi:hypothetical protein
MGAEILSQQHRDQKLLLETQHNEINELHATLIQEFLTLLTAQMRPQEEVIAFQKEEEKRKQGTYRTRTNDTYFVSDLLNLFHFTVLLSKSLRHRNARVSKKRDARIIGKTIQSCQTNAREFQEGSQGAPCQCSRRFTVSYSY